MKIGGKIKLRRIDLGWSLQELADRMGYANKSTIARVESGKIDPPQSKVVKFAEVLGVSIAYLMGWDEEQEQKENPLKNEGISVKRQALIDFANSVPEEKAELVLRVMKSILEGDE